MTWISFPPEEYVMSNERLERWYKAWGEVFDKALALRAFLADPDSDIDLIEAVERAYGVTP
ncbi:hypothetical protein SEA_DAUDAU_38 [Streptomyces phage Daudau]|uniref:Uncharacterized protein n=1 Tax=Streptomyces phage Daudau TaxID=2041206 RepID=A0A291LH88_9CAUD|nr:hypothetical protein KGG88_gp38 [Streptomyces phage Daudau]ATI18739.1 hypothetical protein SEA_DAUDAU_38 [Streptomyces phage Daudau]